MVVRHVTGAGGKSGKAWKKGLKKKLVKNAD